MECLRMPQGFPAESTRLGGRRWRGWVLGTRFHIKQSEQPLLMEEKRVREKERLQHKPPPRVSRTTPHVGGVHRFGG